jgi:hypothetical protein
MSNQFDAGLSEAILAFNAEAVPYCSGISDMVAQEYARNYARMLLNRAKGDEWAPPRMPHGLFEPTRKLIQSNLDRLREKHFSPK